MHLTLVCRWSGQRNPLSSICGYQTHTTSIVLHVATCTLFQPFRWPPPSADGHMHLTSVCRWPHAHFAHCLCLQVLQAPCLHLQVTHTHRLHLDVATYTDSVCMWLHTPPLSKGGHMHPASVCTWPSAHSLYLQVATCTLPTSAKKSYSPCLCCRWPHTHTVSICWWPHALLPFAGGHRCTVFICWWPLSPCIQTPCFVCRRPTTYHLYLQVAACALPPSGRRPHAPCICLQWAHDPYMHLQVAICPRPPSAVGHIHPASVCR
jgi:hypothetical protein